ncbi:MAG TPA: hypothetical protein HA257_09545 [Candidatus Methanoperedenaceae archaeon]|nr:hypothetical protein [Candidatus Methanoperedenaceae archaeon]
MINMSEKRPEDMSGEELKDFVDRRFDDLREALNEVEKRKKEKSAEENIQDVVKDFTDLSISLTALSLKLASGAAAKISKEAGGVMKIDVAESSKKAKVKLADELEKAAQRLRG